MRRLTAVGLAVAVVILAACGVRRHGMIEAPAPDHRAALDCALNEATARGYAPTDGGVDAGYIYLVRRANRGITREEVATRLLTFGLMGHDDVDFDYLFDRRRGRAAPHHRVRRDGEREGVRSSRGGPS